MLSSNPLKKIQNNSPKSYRPKTFAHSNKSNKLNQHLIMRFLIPMLHLKKFFLIILALFANFGVKRGHG
jgi:hypothetical protein